MSREPKSLGLSVDLHRYLVSHGTPPDAVLQRLITDTEAMGSVAAMQIAPEQGTFLTMLARLLRAKRIVELGTFTGYSSVCLARGLEPGGKLICCDVSEEYTNRARQAWREAGVEDRVELRLAPALDTLRSLPVDEPIDLSFLDAHKPEYSDYFDELLPRTRPGGVIAVDNVLWSGNVIDESDQSEDTVGIRAFNDKVVADPRVFTVMLPIADGLTLCYKL
jgi:caffeoyl-CoA O-methyltransferase